MAVFEKVTAKVTDPERLKKVLPSQLSKEQEGILRKGAQKRVKGFRKVTAGQVEQTIKMVVETVGKQGGAPCTSKQLKSIAEANGLTDKSVARTIAEADGLHPVGCNRKNSPWRVETKTLKARATKFGIALDGYKKISKAVSK